MTTTTVLNDKMSLTPPAKHIDEPAMIAVKDLNKFFGNFQAAKDVTFEAVEGKITALLGPSGSGKSTVLRMIAGLERTDSGHIYLDGKEQTRTSVQDRRVGMVFQHYALFRHMNVRQNISFGLSVRKESKRDQQRRVDELLELVQLAPYGNRYPEQLSGGQRQRVALARALAPRPKVLLLDEPFGALDARVRQDLRKWLDELHRELGVTSILVTHDQEEALELAHRVVVMHEGDVQQVGTPEIVYNQPATPFVAGFVGSANVINGLVIGGHVQFGEQMLDGAGHLSDGSAATAYVRPHDVKLSLSPNGGSNTQGTVRRVADLGWASKVSLELTDGQRLVAHSPNDQIHGIGDGSLVYVDLRDAKVFSPKGVRPSDELAQG
ncbi:MAG: sulfate/molybdate ABC transporter ATP-binding protein [Actinomycetota bacterium]